MIFPVGKFIIPTDELIFSEGLKPLTRLQWWFKLAKIVAENDDFSCFFGGE